MEAIHTVRVVGLALLVALAGCSTPKVSPIDPRSAKSFVVKRELKPFDPERLPKYRILQWDVCGPQPEGTLYRVYDTDDFSYWAIYAETPFQFVLIDPKTQTCHFFMVSAFLDGIEVFGSSAPCP